MLRKANRSAKCFFLAFLAAWFAVSGSAATFGRVVSIGGHASDIALDEPRGVLYIANYTASRIDVMSLADSTVARSMSVAAYPASLALSPDGRYLVITHYGNFDQASAFDPRGPLNAVTIVDLSDSSRRTFALSGAPLESPSAPMPRR